MASDRSAKDKSMAAYLKARGIERTTGRCAVCYRMITVQTANEARHSRTSYSHICKG